MRYEALGGYELLLDAHLGALLRLKEANRMLRPLFERDVFAIDKARLYTSRFGPVAQRNHRRFDVSLDSTPRSPSH